MKCLHLAVLVKDPEPAFLSHMQCLRIRQCSYFEIRPVPIFHLTVEQKRPEIEIFDYLSCPGANFNQIPVGDHHMDEMALLYIGIERVFRCGDLRY
jgi:hypothetical protein